MERKQVVDVLFAERKCYLKTKIKIEFKEKDIFKLITTK